MNPIRGLARARTTRGVREAIQNVRAEWEICQRHRASLKQVPRFVGNGPIKLHLGSGERYKQGWVNIDLFHPKADLQLDLRDPWPFPSESAERIYSEHVFEHFEHDEQAPHFLRESLRILKPGGIFEVGVPDTEWALRSYGHPEEGYWEIARKFHPLECATQLDHINYHFRQGREHKYAWDCENLSRMLERHGFVGIERRGFDPGMDTAERNPGTLYLRARRG